MRYKIGNKSVNALITPLFYLFYTGGFGKYYGPVIFYDLSVKISLKL